MSESKNDERFNFLKKYMCKWQPTESLSVCKCRAGEKDYPSEVICGICFADSFLEYCDRLWQVVTQIGVRDSNLALILSIYRESHEKMRVGFKKFAWTAMPEFDNKLREKWADEVESMIEKGGIGHE